MRQVLRLLLILATLLASGPTLALAGSCVAERSDASELRSESHRTGGSGGPDELWWIATALLTVLAFLIGRAGYGKPTQAETLAKLEDAFRGRRHEASVHARKRLPAPLAEARRAVLKAMEGLGHIAPGWPHNPPAP